MERVVVAGQSQQKWLEARLNFSPQISATLSTQAGVDAGSGQTVCDAPVTTETPSLRNSLLGRLFGATTGFTGFFLPKSNLKERVNILLLGSDSRPGEKYGHADSIMLVTLDPVGEKAGILSIPRDLWLTVPGFGERRINEAYLLGQRTNYPGGGPALTMETIETNLGVAVDYYVSINFDGFTQMIDTLGGIEVCVPETIDSAAHYGYQATYINKAEYYSFVPVSLAGVILEDQNSGAADSATTTAEGEEERGYQFLYIEAGLHTLDGDTALNYARSRASITSDFARVQRQQAVLLAIRDKALQVDIIRKLPELWETMNSVVETNLELPDIIQLAQAAQDISSTDIQMASIGIEQTTNYTTNTGAQVLLPEWEEIDALITDMFGETSAEETLSQNEQD
jgi:LCP family protein required for cell wall assembly